MSVSCVILGWRPQFYHNCKNGFVTTEASRASCEMIFYASESCVRALSGACRFILHFAILRHKNAKNFHTPENIRLDNAFLKMHVLLRFKQFFGPENSLKISHKDLLPQSLPERVASWFLTHLKAETVGFPVHIVSFRNSQYCVAKWDIESEPISKRAFSMV